MHWNIGQSFELHPFDNVPSHFNAVPHHPRSCSAFAGRDSLRSVSLTTDAATLLALEHHSAQRHFLASVEFLGVFRFVSFVNATGIHAIPPVFSSASMHSLFRFSSSQVDRSGPGDSNRGGILLRHCGDFVSPLSSSITLDNASHQRASSIQHWNIFRGSAGLRPSYFGGGYFPAGSVC
jgi:hypothetical protein